MSVLEHITWEIRGAKLKVIKELVKQRKPDWDLDFQKKLGCLSTPEIWTIRQDCDASKEREGAHLKERSGQYWPPTLSSPSSTEILGPTPEDFAWSHNVLRSNLRPR